MASDKEISATDVVGARDEILNLIQGNLKNNIIYFDGWNGFGATAVLRSIAQAIPSMKSPPPKLCFGRTIYIDCSRWESKRAMQRKIAQELRLDRKTMAMFDEQDEEDDFNGVDHGSRDVIRDVSSMIAETLRESRFMMIFINGSADEVALTEFGIIEYYGIIIWTFGRRFVNVHELYESDFGRHRYTGLFVYTEQKPTGLSYSQFNALFREEAANMVTRYPFMQDLDLTMVIDCCRYGLFLRRIFDSTSALEWAAHAPNFWICDRIMQQGDRAAREISNALDSEITFEGDASLLYEVFRMLMQHPKTSHLIVEEEDDGNSDKYGQGPYRWICISSEKNIVQGNMQTILASASTVFLLFDKTTSAPRLPNAMFKQCIKLGVLILSGCSFSFASPPFLHCSMLRFLGLGNCTHHNNTSSELEGGVCMTKWTSFLQNLLVLDLHYTDWGEILSEEKIDLMANLTELNIEGVRCWKYTCHLLQSRLPYLERLRIIKPAHQEETTSLDMDNSFVGKKQLEVLDLSGNSDMKSLPGSLSEASKLQVVVLDGCDGLENVELHNSFIRSFSFDGYGPASHWTSTGKLPPMSSRPSPAEKKDDARASKISLEGCTLLDDLFLRGLPKLEELDLSGCAIKVLDFGAMVVDVPSLKRLFLLGCENLHAIKWGSSEQRLKLICIDTRPVYGRTLGCSRRRRASLGFAQQKEFFQLQVHAVFADARLARSLCPPINHARENYVHYSFNISIISSDMCMETVQPEATTNKKKVTGSIGHEIAARDMYCDVFTKVGNGAAPMQTFPKGPTGQLDKHIEIGDGSRSLQSEVEASPYAGNNLAALMRRSTESLHVHDVSTCSNTMCAALFYNLRWCRVERCPNLRAVFSPGAEDWNGTLETIWASDLLMARCVWSKGGITLSGNRFTSLKHLHLRCCPSLQFGLAMGWRPSFPNLETLHIIHCGSLRHVFVPRDEKNKYTSVEFPKLTTIHLHDLPALQQIYEAGEMLAPALETVRIRGCWSLRRLPALKGRNEPARKTRPVLEIEKDVWDALEWDGVDAGHHPSLYEAPVHSRYYKRRVLRTTVLR